MQCYHCFVSDLLCVVSQESFTLEKYVEKLAQLDQRTGLGPLSKSKVKPFDAQVRIHIHTHDPCIPSNNHLGTIQIVPYTEEPLIRRLNSALEWSKSKCEVSFIWNVLY